LCEPSTTVLARDAVATCPAQATLFQTPRKFPRLFVPLAEIGPEFVHQCRRWKFIDFSIE